VTGDGAHQEGLAIAVGAFVDELIVAGVRHFCVCPGSRSTPLALTIARHPAMRSRVARLWMHVDERSAAFFGLGLAKAAREPVALVCTSGTAAANFLPAVVEAFYGRVPLIVLTADRPHELRDCGAPQTIDQVRLFGSHAKWFFDLPLPEASDEAVHHLRTIASRGVATARERPAGPVHVNCPYREPLIPTWRRDTDDSQWTNPPSVGGNGPEPWPAHGQRGSHQVVAQPWVEVVQGPRVLAPGSVEALASALHDTRRGLLVCGPQDDPELADAVIRLAKTMLYPVLADPLSLVRCGPHDRTLVLDAYDAFLRDAAFVERHAPDLVVRFGAMPTSKPLLLYLQRHRGIRHILVDGEGGWNDPAGLATTVVHADGRGLCDALSADERGTAWGGQAGQSSGRAGGAAPGRRAPGQCGNLDWFAAWHTANRLAREAIAAEFAGLDELFEGKVFAELASLLPDGALLYAGNSMPVRDLDSFFAGCERRMRFLANRGANGIDGVVSSALGAGAVGEGPLVLVIGDLSFYHDANGLLAAKKHGLRATIVLLNNDGGGIFSFLPQAADQEHFETLFGTPQGLNYRTLAETYGATLTRVSSWDGFRRAVQGGLEADGLTVVEVPTDRQRNVTLHREMWQAVSRALAPTSVAAYE
jgi:2-succinyl-5-enolpyruvyl-6-hydroxy-3-cyclohexene-1-carboxylate synthase